MKAQLRDMEGTQARLAAKEYELACLLEKQTKLTANSGRLRLPHASTETRPQIWSWPVRMLHCPLHKRR